MTIQDQHNTQYDAAITADTNLPVGSVVISGKHTLTSTLEINPWIKIKADSPTHLDFKGMTIGTAIEINTEDTQPNTPMLMVSNLSPCLNGSSGVIAIEGAGKTTSTLGISLGNTIDIVNQGDAPRDISLDGVSVHGFRTGVQINSRDTYLANLRNGRIHDCECALVALFDAGRRNSGERHSMDNMVLGSCDQGIYIDNPAIDLNIINSSIDFCKESVLKFGTNAGYNKISFSQCHLEGSNDDALIRSYGTADNINVDINSCQCVPTNTPNIAGARNDNASLPRTELFKGKMNLSIDGLIIGYQYPSHDANNGFFLIDDDVNIISVKNVSFTGWKQALAAALVLNCNWNFDKGNNWDVLDETSPLLGWNVRSAGKINNITAKLSTAQTFNGSTHSLELTCTDGTSNWFEFDSAAFNVEAGELVTNQVAIFGGTSTGDARVSYQLVQFMENDDGTLTEIDVSGGTGQDFEDLYNDAADPSYNAGARNMWFKGKTLSEKRVVQGATKAKLRMTISTMDTNDVIYLGACIAQKI